MNALLLLTACKPAAGDVDELFDRLDPGDLTESDAAETWAAAHTRLILDRTYARVAIGDSPFEDANCPLRGQDSDGDLWQGDCTDADGQEWKGTLAVSADRVESTGFGTKSADLFSSNCFELAWGTSDQDDGGDVATYTIRAGLWRVCGSGNVTDAWAVDYVATVTTGGTGIEVFDGAGSVGQWKTGLVSTVTTGMYFDACGDEPDAGQTLVTSDDHDLLYEYGVDACDGTVPVSLDGEHVADVEFPLCAVAPGAGVAAALAAALFAGVRRRSP